VTATKKNAFDVIIVGAGPAGLFCAYWLAEHGVRRILVLDKGQGPRQRKCPIAGRQGGECVRCQPCNILSGVGGAGLFSDGKLNFIHILGKTDLTQFLPAPEAMALIEETETVFTRFGMDGPVYPTDMELARDIRRNARRQGLDLLLIRQKHLGSDHLPGLITGMADYIGERGATFRTGEEVTGVVVEDGRACGVTTVKGTYRAPAVVLAPGRVGAEWMGRVARTLGLPVSQRGIEVGVRVEVHNDIMDELTSVIYDPTFFIRTDRHDDLTRTFCTNRGGFVALENYQDFVCVNGHAYRDKKSDNTNFAFLSKVVLTEPVTDNQAYGESIGRLATIIGGGKPILQRFGDLRRGRRSTWAKVKAGYLQPTMTDVVCGDISMALPGRIMTNLCEGLTKLNQVVPGVTNDETLLYAPEIKFFATQVGTSKDLETRVAGLFVAGDGPGAAGNIVSAAATGIIPAKAILARRAAGGKGRRGAASGQPSGE
jgi:uncharacterized FAD-dependent dehydrogenase